jgi:stage II sporulation protein D
MALAIGLGAGVRPVVAESAEPGTDPAPAERHERIEALYAHRLLFDRRGEPMVTVGLAENARTVTLHVAGPTTLLAEGDEAFALRLPPQTTFTVTLEDARQARRRHWLVAERFTPSRMATGAVARTRFVEADLETALFEAGALAGARGRLFDTRTITLAVSPGDTVAEARRGLSRARSVGFVGGEDLVELVIRPGGRLTARDMSRGYDLVARDLIWVRPEDPSPTEVRVDGRVVGQYAGELYVTVGADGRLVVGNLASAEVLLASVVPSETFPSAPAAALAAQAVVARGQFLAKLGLKHRGDPFMLCNRWHCQAHGGQGRATPQTDAAVQATRGQVLVSARGGLVDTVYHSACGGRTEAWDVAWGGEVRTGLSGVDDARDGASGEAYCAVSGRRNGVYRWTRTLTGAEVTRRAQRLHPVGPVVDLRVTRQGPSGRVYGLEIVGTRATHRIDGEPAIRRLLGGLRSTLFTMERDGPPGREAHAWRIAGAGYGHGVGLCQHGAIGQAKAGRDYPAILQHYFPGTRLESVW